MIFCILRTQLVRFKMYTVAHLLIFSSLLFLNVHSWRKVKLTPSTLSYNVVKDYADMNATLHADGSLSFYVTPTVHVDRLFLNFALILSSGGGGSKKFDINFLNKTVDVCKFAQNPRYEPLIQLVYKILSEKIRLPQRCPVRKNDLFYVQNYNIVTDRFPPVLRDTEILCYLAFSTLKGDVLQKVCDVSVEAMVKYLN